MVTPLLARPHPCSSEDPMPLHLFLAHADTHEPVLAGGLSPASAHDAPRPSLNQRKPPHLAERSGLADALPTQRYGLIVPRGDIGKRLLERITRLKDKRQEDQKAEAVVYEVDPGMG